jgi:hypothetical protein
VRAADAALRDGQTTLMLAARAGNVEVHRRAAENTARIPTPPSAALARRR